MTNNLEHSYSFRQFLYNYTPGEGVLKMACGSCSVAKPSDVFSLSLKPLLSKTTPLNDYVYDDLDNNHSSVSTKL